MSTNPSSTVGPAAAETGEPDWAILLCHHQESRVPNNRTGRTFAAAHNPHWEQQARGLMVSMSKPMQNRRRLFELLEEKQEPFLLHVYLLEHGCSGRAVKSPAASYWLENARMKRRRGWMISFVLKNFSCNKVRAHVSGSWGTFCSFFKMGSKTQVAESRLLQYSSAFDGETDAEVQRRTAEEKARKLSPISVLELHFDEVDEETSSTPVLISPREADRATEELICYTSSTGQKAHTRRHSGQRHLLLDFLGEAEGKIWNTHEGPSPTKRTAKITEEILSWEMQRVMASTWQVIEFDLSTSRKEWYHSQPEIRDIGVEIESIIFEDIREETALVLLGSQCSL